MNCDEVIRLMDAHVDQELYLKDILEIEKHLKSCSSCRHRHRSLGNMKKVFKNVDRFKPGTTLQESIQARLDSDHGRRWYSQAPVLKVALPSFVAGSVAYALITFAVVFGGDDPARHIADAHIRSLMASHILDMRSSDKHKLKPWLNQVLDFSPPVRDLAPLGYTLLGARLDYFDGIKAVALVYQVRNHHINLFIWPQEIKAGSGSGTAAKNIRGYRMQSWSERGLRFAAISDVHGDELAKFATMYRNSIKNP